MAGYPNDQGNPAAAIPVWIAGVGGADTPPALGDILYGNADGGLSMGPLNAGSNVTIDIDPDTGALTINSTGGGGGGSGTVTSVAASGGTTGLSFTGSPITVSGTLTLTGTLVVANGGTGITNDVTIVDIPFVIDGGGIAITTGLKGWIVVDFACTIQSATLLADQSGSIVVDVWKCTYSAYAPPTHPASGDSITASAPPTISSATKSQDATLTGWTTSISAGDVLAFNVNSATTVQRVTLSLKVKRT